MGKEGFFRKMFFESDKKKEERRGKERYIQITHKDGKIKRKKRRYEYDD